APSQREVGDVNLVAAQHTADVADHARHILILHENQVPGKRGLAIDFVDAHQARLVEQHRTLDGGDAGIGFELEPNRVAVAGTRLVTLSDVPAALRGDLHGVHQVRLA